MLTENSALYFTENWYEIFGNFLFWSCQGQNQCPRRDYWARPHQVAAYNYIGDCIKEQNEEGDESIVIHIIWLYLYHNNLYIFIYCYHYNHSLRHIDLPPFTTAVRPAEGNNREGEWHFMSFSPDIMIKWGLLQCTCRTWGAVQCSRGWKIHILIVCYFIVHILYYISLFCINAWFLLYIISNLQ